MFDQALNSPTARPSLTPVRPSSSLAGGTGVVIESPLTTTVSIPIIERTSPPRARGFAAMDKDRQRQIASAGGRAAHECGNAHEFTSEEARSAGRKGGVSISQNKAHMAAIGSKGGLTRGERQRDRQPPSA